VPALKITARSLLEVAAGAEELIQPEDQLNSYITGSDGAMFCPLDDLECTRRHPLLNVYACESGHWLAYEDRHRKE